jgi:pimeloyl-ACP methyl ester carboxylesterase
MVGLLEKRTPKIRRFKRPDGPGEYIIFDLPPSSQPFGYEPPVVEVNQGLGHPPDYMAELFEGDEEIHFIMPYFPFQHPELTDVDDIGNYCLGAIETSIEYGNQVNQEGVSLIGFSWGGFEQLRAITGRNPEGILSAQFYSTPTRMRLTEARIGRMIAEEAARRSPSFVKGAVVGGTRYIAGKAVGGTSYAAEKASDGTTYLAGKASGIITGSIRERINEHHNDIESLPTINTFFPDASHPYYFYEPSIYAMENPFPEEEIPGLFGGLIPVFYGGVGGFGRLASTLFREEFPEGKIYVPTLAVIGDRDNLVNVNSVDRIRDISPLGSEVVVIEGGSHGLREHADEVRKTAIEFADKHRKLK